MTPPAIADTDPRAEAEFHFQSLCRLRFLSTGRRPHRRQAKDKRQQTTYSCESWSHRRTPPRWITTVSTQRSVVSGITRWQAARMSSS